ncbi:MAG: hypothetical protein KZQ82_19020 [Candidatus Thiodiazotropha sp. (ex Lucinoma annulata)]|nr:hypothetical protein [Candidatus Thiodiazotropha sp. (ex Lucinoma annulata)]
MGIFDNDSDLLHEARVIVKHAKEKLEKVPEDKKDILRKWVGNVLVIWKHKHSEPPSTRFRFKDPDFDDYEKYAPYECAGAGIKNPIDLGFLLIKNKFPELLECEKYLGWDNVLLQLMVMTEPTVNNLSSLITADKLIREFDFRVESMVNDQLSGEIKKLIPDYLRGRKQTSDASEGGKARARLFENEKKVVKDIALKIISERSFRVPSKRELASLVVKQRYPHITEETEISKKADSIRKWI